MVELRVQSSALRVAFSSKVGFVPWGPLGQGFLPGTMDVSAQSAFDPKTDLRATFPRFSPMVMRNNQPIIELLNDVPEWRDARADRAGVVDGAEAVDRSNLRHDEYGSLRENMNAVKVQLTPTDLREIEIAFARIEIYGGRMDAIQMAQIGQDAD